MRRTDWKEGSSHFACLLLTALQNCLRGICGSPLTADCWSDVILVHCLRSHTQVADCTELHLLNAHMGALAQKMLACRNIAAVRSANVLVTIHGSGSNNALFMEEGSTLIEVRPYQFGTKAHKWANAFMPKVSSLGLGCQLTLITAM